MLISREEEFAHKLKTGNTIREGIQHCVFAEFGRVELDLIADHMRDTTIYRIRCGDVSTSYNTDVKEHNMTVDFYEGLMFRLKRGLERAIIDDYIQRTNNSRKNNYYNSYIYSTKYNPNTKVGQ